MVTLALAQYLETIKDNLRLDKSAEKEVILELQTHIEEKFEELKEAGLSDEEATHTCLKLLGSAKVVARQLYEAHCQCSWKHTMLAAMPHLLFALAFMLNWWQGIGWLLLIVTLIFGTAIYGWVRGKPTWLFPWLGYSLLPVVVAGLILFYLPKDWSWIAIIFYLPVAAWLVYHTTVQTIRRDWLYSSLMLLPVPLVVAWFVAAGLNGVSNNFNENLRYYGPWTGLTFLIMAVTVAIFVRIRKRWLKIALLLMSGILSLALVSYYTGGRLNLPSFLILLAVILGLFITPAVLEHRIRHGNLLGIDKVP